MGDRAEQRLGLDLKGPPWSCGRVCPCLAVLNNVVDLIIRVGDGGHLGASSLEQRRTQRFCRTPQMDYARLEPLTEVRVCEFDDLAATAKLKREPVKLVLIVRCSRQPDSRNPLRQSKDCCVVASGYNNATPRDLAQEVRERDEISTDVVWSVGEGHDGS
jgi:hypothetical protein